MDRPNGNGRSQAHAAGIGGALGIVVIAVLTQAAGVHIDAVLGGAITTLTSYASAWLPKPSAAR